MKEADEILEVKRVGDRVVISIGVNTLLTAIQGGPHWPQEDSDDECKIVDEALFIDEIIAQLQLEEEDGATDIHKAFDDAAIRVLEWGSESIEFEHD